MKGMETDTSPWVARAAALLIAAAVSLAVFYHGPQLALLAGVQTLLIVWLAFSSARSYASIRLPLTPLSVSLSLFWLWLAITLYWTAVPVTSVINFWWIGTPALVFWCYILSPDRDRIRFYLTRLLPVGALALCVLAMIQLFVWHEPPRATFINIHSFAALLMLMALPLSAYFLLLQYQRARRAFVVGVGVCLFVLFFTIAITEGRGTTLSLILGMTTLSALAWTSVGTRPILSSVGLLIGAYALAYLTLYDGLTGGRLVTLADPMSAGVPRFLIWRGSWDLLMANPWWGIGLGTYYLAWPPYRDPADSTLGFFVHNDYLQIWIEGGLPALLLLLAVFGSILFMLVRFLRRKPAANIKLEALGLFSGLLAVAAHSAVDFDLYILPIGALAGLALGRFQECVGGTSPPRELCLRPDRIARPWLYRVAVVLFALLPISYFLSLGISDQLFKRGFALATEGQLQDADRAFTNAENLFSFDDKVLVSHAELYRRVLERMPTAADAERRALFEASLAMLDEAESANPYRPLTHALRARILQQNPDLAGPEWRAQVEAAYLRALTLDPRFFASRVGYAELLLETDRAMEAYGVLESGMVYWYYPGRGVLAYYDFASRLAKQVGQSARAEEIERLRENLRQAIANTVPARPAVQDPSLPVAASAT
jgi:O-antigen ligase